MFTKSMRLASLITAFALITGVSLTGPATLVYAADEVTEGAVVETQAQAPAETPEVQEEASIQADIVIIPTENTLIACTDDIDNDDDFFTDLADTDCAAFVPVATSTEPVATTSPEITFDACHDNVDNDDDFFTDLADPDCVAFFDPVATSTASTTPENTAVTCSDDIDNDNDFFTDLADTDCAAFIPAATSTATSTPAPSNEGTGNGGGTGGQQTGGGGVTSFLTTSGSGGTPVSGTVLGASTDDAATTASQPCSAVLNDYLKMGKKNSSLEVKKLQVILNAFVGSKLPINGVFGLATKNAVDSFQVKYSAYVLQPWVNAGLMPTPAPTGYVYKTTKWHINNLMCGGQIAPQPMLP